MRQLQKKIKSGKLDLKEDDPFELFIAATNIRYCYYSETHKILGNTFGMCVLQVWLIVERNFYMSLWFLSLIHHLKTCWILLKDYKDIYTVVPL